MISANQMQKFANDQMIKMLENISKQPVEVYSQKEHGKGKEKQYFLSRSFVENIIDGLKKANIELSKL